ncbi:hypothetical protein ACWEQ7_22020 [Streptomyces sp. NPDC004069]
MPDIAEVLARAKPRERTVRVCLAGDLAGEAERLEAEIARVSAEEWEPSSIADRHPGRPLAAQLAEVNRQIHESAVEFRFRYVGDRAYSDLVAAHPSKDPGQAFDSESFPRALIAACCIDPVMTVDQVAELFEVLTQAQIKDLFDAAWDVCNAQVGAVPFSLAVSALLASIDAK